MHGAFELLFDGGFHNRFDELPATPNQLRWNPLPLPSAPTDFIDGLFTMAGNGSAAASSGVGIHLYAANALDAGPLLLQRRRRAADRAAAGPPAHRAPSSACSRSSRRRSRVHPARRALPRRAAGRRRARLRLRELRRAAAPAGPRARSAPTAWPIARDFLTPVAAYEDIEGDFELVAKFQGRLWRAPIGHSPLDVVGWHGNYAPYKYDLRRFNTIGSISYDHPDPSIFTVLTSPSDTPGTANLDFVIFPPRWLVAQDTFRPPWFHRNVASEFMGLVHGVYDAKAEGFLPGGASLHNCMSGHGPDAATFEKASARRPVEARRHHRHHGLHVRDARGDPADAAGDGIGYAASRLPAVLGRAAAQLHGTEDSMKLGSLKEGGRDGTLIVVSRDLTRAVKATGIAPRCSARWRTGSRPRRA